jgi:prevent-host-death family protein
MYKYCMSTITVSEARAALPEILHRVSEGDEVTLTRHGRAVAVIVRPDTLRSRRADSAQNQAAAVHGVLSVGRRTALAARPTLTAERAEELVAEVRTLRSDR